MTRCLFACIALAFASVAPALAANPCTLLKPAEVTKAVGTAVGPATPEKVQGGTACRWTSADYLQGAYIQITTDAGAADVFNSIKAMNKPVAGVGVPAYYFGGNAYMMKHGVLLLVGITKGEATNNTPDPKLPALAKLVYGRL